MFTSPLLVFSFLLLLFSTNTTTTTGQPYKPTDYILLNCGGQTAISDRKWDTDEHSEFVPSTTTTASFTSTTNNLDPSAPELPYSTARIFNTSSFTYTFPVTIGPKFLRLYFYPATYSHYNANQSFFSVSSNGYALLTNFSAFLTASFLGTTLDSSPQVPHLIKEFIIRIKDTQSLNVTFTPSPNSYAFINGIEIVSLPDNLYHNSKSIKYVGQNSGPVITEDTGLENMYRLNVGGGYISPTDDTGMYRSWDQDDPYLFYGNGLTPVNRTPIVYTEATPNYTAPELLYTTQRSMGELSESYNLTWLFPVDSGFWYKLRFHFSNIIPQYTRQGEVVFKIFINNQTAEEYADVFYWSGGTGIPVFKDYVVCVYDFDGSGRKQDLWLAMHPNRDASDEYGDAFLNGLEVFKISMGGNLSSPNPELMSSTTTPPRSSYHFNKNKKSNYSAIIAGVGGGGFALLSGLVLTVLWRQRRRRANDQSCSAPTSNNHELKSTKSYRSSSLPSDRCRYFTLREVKFATDDFTENCVIGNGGFGKVYKGYMDKDAIIVAIKRLNQSSSQGFHEFRTEIAMLSKLRHVNLVSLIGYCDDEGEMILVYEYMAHGTLREHLYKTNNPPLSWKTRLNICIAAAKGLHYLHTSGSRRIIHRDVKSTNILLDEKWVAKVSDFGLSRLGSIDPLETHVSTLVKGSIGYIDPQYCKTKHLTDKSDVYSFGVVLLEVLCARPVILQQLAEEQVSLVTWGKSCYRRGILHEVIDPKISSDIAPGCLRKFGEVANSCLHEEATERPSMEEVVWGLEFALKLQELADETITENQELPLLMHG